MLRSLRGTRIGSNKIADMAGNNDGKLLHGQRHFPRDGYTAAFTQRVKDNRDAELEVGDANKEITPLDGHSSRIVTWDTAAIATEFLTLYRSMPTTINMQLPPVLDGISVTFNSQAADGEANTLSQDAYSAGTSGSLSFSPRSNARASAAILPDVVPIIREVSGVSRPATLYAFFLPNNSTRTAVLTRLATITGQTVRDWPQFKPTAETLVLKGQEGSVTLGASADHNDRWSEDNLSFGIYTQGEVSRSVGLTNKLVRLPACVHGDLTISSPTQTATGTVTVSATIPQIVGTGIAPSFPQVTVAPTPRTITVTGSVFPTFLPATPGGTIPTSGLYLYSLETQPAEWDHIQVLATIVDCSIFA